MEGIWKGAQSGQKINAKLENEEVINIIQNWKGYFGFFNFALFFWLLGAASFSQSYPINIDGQLCVVDEAFNEYGN